MLELRWQQRFENFAQAYTLLQEALTLDMEALSDLEKEGLIQRFEYTFELAWKTIHDYLVFQGIQVDPITPRNVMRQAFAAGLIQDGQSWIDMLEHRNLMSHTYDRESFQKAVAAIHDRYGKVLEQLYLRLKAASEET